MTTVAATGDNMRGSGAQMCYDRAFEPPEPYANSAKRVTHDR